MRNYLFLIISLCCLTAFISCQDEDFGVSAEEVAASAYANNFIKAYGPIAPEQDWGFKTIPNTETRAGSESHKLYKLAKQSNRYRPELQNGSDNYINDPDDISFINKNYVGSYLGDTIPQWKRDEKDYVRQYLIDNPDKGDLSCGLDSYLVYNFGYQNNGDNVGFMDKLMYDGVHINDLNGGGGEDYYVTNSLISNPYYHNSNPSSDIKNHYRFYFIPEHITEDGYHFPGGLYLCFDYPSRPSGTYDNVFNDWVLKIQPGDMSRSKTARRVFCEDLGNTHDWDFNDVVYDYIQYTDNVAQIKIYAVCGTLPIYFTINGNIVKLSQTALGAGILNWAWTESDEIHRLLGNRKKQDNTYDQIEYRATERATYYVKCSDIMDLGIMRETDGGEPWYCIPSQQTGKVPFMIACPVGTTPSGEDVDIKTTYPNFSKYPSNPYIIWW